MLAAPSPSTPESALRGRLIASCPDRPGIVAAVSAFVLEHGANVAGSHQHSTGLQGGRFFLRLDFELEGRANLEEMRDRFAVKVAEPLGMTFRLEAAQRKRRLAVLTSREDHCLLDLLWRGERGELGVEIALVVSNHETLRERVEMMGHRFLCIPVTPETKPEAERRLLGALPEDLDLIVLARYMQVLSADFLDAVRAPIINIHHSFLPAFAGADPYRQAFDRGVKMVGATAHYVTEELDAGPIIEQDIARAGYSDDVDALVRIGRDVERMVLARAVRWHVEDRILTDGNRTIVFA